MIVVGGADLRIDFDPSVPIYLQIIDEIKRQIATGALAAGDKLPSQRDLAADLHVNANTVQRAYREMELEGLVETLRGQGTFICRDPDLVERTRTEMLTKLVEDFIRSMCALGCSEENILAMVRMELEKKPIISNVR